MNARATSLAVENAANLLLNAKYAVALTGAGISTPSGIPDFRSPTSGLWEQHDPMAVASIHGFTQAPKQFYEWVRPLAQLMLDAKPNPAHFALAQLEKWGKLKSVITQNIDMLHTRAGSTTVYEVHGHMRTATCLDCKRSIDGEALLQEFLAQSDIVVPHCKHCNGLLKPDTILFGELLPRAILQAAESDAAKCDVMLVAGTALEVYPVADLPRQAVANGADDYHY